MTTLREISLAMAIFTTMNRANRHDFRGRQLRRRRNPRRLTLSGFESLEQRELLATFLVTNPNSAGDGSFRQAIIDSNSQPGSNIIKFDIAGTISTGNTSLPAITNTVSIDGTSAPTFAGRPVVTIDFQGTQGLQFDAGSDYSSLISLALVRAGGVGLTLSSSYVTVQGNNIGVMQDGQTVAANHGNGVQINASSHGDLIGQLSSQTYYDTAQVGIQPVSAWQGIRGGDVPGQYLIVGTSDSSAGDNGLLYVGPISGAGGTAYQVDYPYKVSGPNTATSVYGPDNLGGGVYRLVGSYHGDDGVIRGFVFQGTTAELSQADNWATYDYPNSTYTFVHSTMGDLAVGNADGPEGNLPLGSGTAFLLDVSDPANPQLVTDISYPGLSTLSTTAYGIWYNGGTSYTICGGYSQNTAGGILGHGYLVDYDSATGMFSNWTSFDYPNGVNGKTYDTHFEGISSVENGTYTLSADSVERGSTNPAQGSFVTVKRNIDGTFGDPTWVNLNQNVYPGTQGISSANSVYGNQVVGVVIPSTPAFDSFQVTLTNPNFTLSNIISGNCGDGIEIDGSDNTVAMNNIGTDVSGTVAIGNRGNGILITKGAHGNLIGGTAINGNNPTGGFFARPPEGNLISGNRANGVLINCWATGNTLSGNFIGTSASGNSALGNRLDGVAIVGADNNSLIGCTFQQDPFVYYNVLSGNGGNGLRITNSNGTTVQANFMGVGANNASIVANGGDGLLVSGWSKNTQVGGPIPLGNVISGNNRNGIEVTDTASNLTSFNTFAGLFAFAGAAPNKKDGILITSSGGGDLIRTCLVGGNLGNGIELGGNATGVQIEQTGVGTTSNIEGAIPNIGDGIRLTGNAHGNKIGGFQLSIEQQVTVSSNYGYGIDVAGHAHDNTIFNTNIGTGGFGINPLGNVRGGIYLGCNTRATTIGGTEEPYRVIVENNQGAGITIRGSVRNVILGDTISNNAAGGIVVINSLCNQIGLPSSSNTIQANGQNGISLTGDVAGTLVQGNTISFSASNGVKLVNARKAKIGGVVPGQGNEITDNAGYGIYFQGDSRSTVVAGNDISGNGQGDTNNQ